MVLLALLLFSGGAMFLLGVVDVFSMRLRARSRRCRVEHLLPCAYRINQGCRALSQPHIVSMLDRDQLAVEYFQFFGSSEPKLGFEGQRRNY